MSYTVDADFLRFLAVSCHVSYLKRFTHFEKYLKNKGYNIKRVHYKDQRCTIIYDDKEAYFVFKGTIKQNVRNLWNNISFVHTKLKGFGKVHSGYLRAANMLYKPIKREIEKLEGRNIYFSGHSQGAAIALILLFLLDNEKINLIGFGCPRCVSHKTMEKLEQFNKNILLIYNNDDTTIDIPIIYRGLSYVGNVIDIYSYFSDIPEYVKDSRKRKHEIKYYINLLNHLSKLNTK